MADVMATSLQPGDPRIAIDRARNNCHELQRLLDEITDEQTLRWAHGFCIGLADRIETRLRLLEAE